MMQDPYPGQPKILFIGLGESSHTHGTINLLDEAEVNVRLFDLPTPYFPPADFRVRTYISTSAATPPHLLPLDPASRTRLYPEPQTASPRLARRLYDEVARSVKYRTGQHHPPTPAEHLARIIREWQPDVIDTLGIHPAGQFYHRTRQQFPDLAGIGVWSLTIRGAPDYELARYDPTEKDELTAILRSADRIISDNRRSLEDALEMGASEVQLTPEVIIPGAGGVDIDAIAAQWQGKPSQRRNILMPKAYESPWSVTLPVFEALQQVWDDIQPCEVTLLSMSTEATRLWYEHLPAKIKQNCHVIAARIRHDELIRHMTGMRVMLAPSLLDGMPNVVLEAMAAGAFPVISPIKTMTPVFEDERNVLFARNLYPDEIGVALRRAMTDDALVDAAAERNLQWVRGAFDIANVRPKAVEYYLGLPLAFNKRVL